MAQRKEGGLPCPQVVLPRVHSSIEGLGRRLAQRWGSLGKLSHHTSCRCISLYIIGKLSTRNCLLTVMAIHPNPPALEGSIQAGDSTTATQPLPLSHTASDDEFITSTPATAYPPNFCSRGDLSPAGLTLTSPNLDSQRAAQAVQKPIGRDSSRQRKALLKGTLGARHRQRWENGIPTHPDLVFFTLGSSSSTYPHAL